MCVLTLLSLQPSSSAISLRSLRSARVNTTEPKVLAAGLPGEKVAALADPVGETIRMWRRPNGLWVGRMRIPLGVIGIIYESRPNVTADAAGLCLKAGNACILRGGSEALHSNQAIAACVRAGLKAAGLPEAAVDLDGALRAAALEADVMSPGHGVIIVGRERIRQALAEDAARRLGAVSGVGGAA